MHFEINNLD